MMHHLIVFISSTADLQQERDTAERALSGLDIDGSRFESWPSTPNSPIDECLKQIEESDAIILILGKRYGSLIDSGISVTHLEYHHATRLKPPKPIFVYLLKVTEREPEQVNFIDEIRKARFHCKEVESTEQLEIEVKHSFLQEFTRCFRKVHSTPPEKFPSRISEITVSSDVPLSDDPREAYNMLQKLYKLGDDLAIHRFAQQCEVRFGHSPEIMNLIFMAEVNLGMAGGAAVKKRLIKAIRFWDSHDARTRWATHSLTYNQGNAFSVLKRFSDAEERYRASLTKKSDFAECWKNLGSVYLEMDDVNSARQCYEEALQQDPKLFEALYCLATLSMQRESDPEKALTYLNRIVILRLPSIQLASVQGWKAIAYRKLDRYAEGIARAEDAIATAPEAEWAWQVAGKLYALARQQTQQWLGPAADFWQRFVAKYPNNAEAWTELGYVYWFLRNHKDKVDLSQRALHAFTKAMELGFEDDGLVWDRIGHLYQEQGNWREAEKAYRQAAQKNPEQFGYCHGVSLISLGRYEEALPLVLAAAQQHQPDATSWFQVAICQENLGNIDEAAAAYKKAIQLDQNYAKAWFNLGGLYWNKGNIPKARAIWKKAMTKFSEHELCHQAKKLLGE